MNGQIRLLQSSQTNGQQVLKHQWQKIRGLAQIHESSHLLRNGVL